MKTPPQGICEGVNSHQSERVFHSPKHPKLEAKELRFAKHVKHFFPDAEGEELRHRCALLSAREYAGKIRCNPIGEIARHHAIDAQQAADHFFHKADASPQELKHAVDYCRHLVRAAFIAEYIDPEVWQ